MDDKDYDRLIELCELFDSKSMQERASAAREASELVHENGLTWSKVFGKSKALEAEAEQEPRGHRFNGFIPFAGEFESTYDEARGYMLLLGTRDENQVLRKIVSRDARINQLSEDEYKLMKHMRDEARDLRDLLLPETFVIKSGRVCRVVSSKP